MEGGGLDFFHAAAKEDVSAACRSFGASRICFSSDGFSLRLDQGRKDRDTEFVPGGIVITDAPCIHFVDSSDSVTDSLPQPNIRPDVEGCPGTMHFTPAQGADWDILFEVPSNRRASLLSALESVFADSLLPPLDITSKVAMQYPWISQELKTRLGLLVKGTANEVRGRWRDEHHTTHTRKRTELDALRSRSRSREKRQQEKREQAGVREEMQQEEAQLRTVREQEAGARLQEQQQRIREEQLKKELEAQAAATELARTKHAADELARMKREAAEGEHLSMMQNLREIEAKQLAEQRQERHERDKQSHAERQEREREIHTTRERLRAERAESEEAHRAELHEMKTRKAEEDRLQRAAVERRYDQSQVHRTERQALSREEERDRLALLRDEAESIDLLQQISEEVSTINTLSLELSAATKIETVERLAIENTYTEDLGDLKWQFDRQYAHVCEIGRRKLMEDEERLRRLFCAKEEAALSTVMTQYLNAQEDAFSPLVADPLDSDEDDFGYTTPARHDASSAPPTMPRARISDNVTVFDDSDSPHRATQTPSYAYVEGRSAGEDGEVATELGKLRKELHHERELRDRTQERIAEHERVMKHKSKQLEDRERKLLEQLSSDHAQRLDEVRTVLQPRVEKTASYDEADRMLRTMHEREEDFAVREKEWRVHQADLERDAARVRDELTRVTELHWLCENDKAELKGRCDAHEVEAASMRTTIARADDRLRHILLEEQELLCKVEEQWKAKLSEAEGSLQDADSRFKRRLEERERHWLQQEQAIRARCERAESEKLALLERVEALQHRTDTADKERSKLREELGAESQLALHRGAMEVRAARDQLEKERRRRVEAEEALSAAGHEQARLLRLLEDARLRSTQQSRDAQVVAAHHESELGRVASLVPTQPSTFSIVTALETASRYGIMSQFQEGFTELMHLFYFRRKPARQGQNPHGLEQHNAMLRELLSLEEAKVVELERTVKELRRQRTHLGGGGAGFNDAVAALVVQECETRRHIEAACRDALVDKLTAKRRKPQPTPTVVPRQRQNHHPAYECSGWLLSCLESRSTRPGYGMHKSAWKQLFMWVDKNAGLLSYSLTDPQHGDGAPVSNMDLSKVVAVEIEMFVDGEIPPPVGKYQQLGFYLEMAGGAKHRFCASSVPERTQWLDSLRRAVLGHSDMWSTEWDPKPSGHTPSRSPPRGRREHTGPTRSRSRSRNRVGFLEHLSYLGMEGQ